MDGDKDYGMEYVKNEDKDTGIVIVKEEYNLEFEELEFDDDKPEVPVHQNDQDVSQMIIKEEIDSDFEGDSVNGLDSLHYEHQEFREKAIELFELQNVSTDTDGSNVPVHQNDQDVSQMIIKEEIDCDIEGGSVNDLDSLYYEHQVPRVGLRRSSRRRCQRFSLGDLLESLSDETPEYKCSKKGRTHDSGSTYNGHCRMSTSVDKLPQSGRGRSGCRTVYGKSRTLPCAVCGRLFSRIGYLKRHSATHCRSGEYPCSFCGRVFVRANNLKQHETVHRGEMYPCAVCGTEFSQLSNLRRHERQHTEERPYRCDDCGKCFRENGALRDHERIHTGERPFVCRTCGKSFRQAAHLRGHARLHTGERRFGCDVCGRRFFRRTHLKIHACGRKPVRRKRKDV